ncbi:cytochrome P450 [Nocardia vinacea]|uniref:cytochrome P450 n=1 Tax=Nocardia vinacea TaxID=96468 RepID=UPI0003015E21|nr:cytochrome P450 [Nocardia vinacea]
MTVNANVSEIAEFELPSLVFPFRSAQVRADATELRARTCTWAQRQGIIGLRGAARLQNSDLLDLGIGMTGSADAEQASVLLDWFLWMLLLDDRVDNGPWASDGVLEEFTRSARAIVEPGVVATISTDPMLRALAGDLWPRTGGLAGSATIGRLAGHVIRHLDAQCAMQAHHRGERDLNLDDYLELRRDLFGADVFFDLIEIVDGLWLPMAGATGALVTRLRACAGDVAAWTNDVFSVEKDLALEEPANLAILLRRDRGGSWQDALDTAGTMIHDRIAQFITIRGELSRTASVAQARSLESFADRLQATMQLCLDWHRTTSRYHWQHATGTPAKTREMISTRSTPPSLLMAGFERDPYTMYRLLRDEFPVVHDEPVDAWLLSRYEDVRFALCDPRFSSRNYSWQLAPMLGRTVFQMEGREHTAHRTAVVPALRGRGLATLDRAIHTAAHDLAARVRVRLDQRGRADLVQDYCRQLTRNIIVAALGLPAQDAAQLQEWYETGFAYVTNARQEPTILAAGMAAGAALFAYLAPHIAERRDQPGDDLLSILCQYRIDGHLLSDDTIKGYCGTLLAGGETTDKAMSSLLANLIDYPDHLAAARTDPHFISAAWAESLRRNPPFHSATRQTTTEVELPSGVIPANATVICLLGAANRDPRRFTDPDLFSPGRTDGAVDREFNAASTHVSFGAGRHFCLGSHLARAIAETGTKVLLDTLPRLRWAEGFTPKETGLLLRSPESLLVQN